MASLPPINDGILPMEIQIPSSPTSTTTTTACATSSTKHIDSANYEEPSAKRRLIFTEEDPEDPQKAAEIPEATSGAVATDGSEEKKKENGATETGASCEFAGRDDKKNGTRRRVTRAAQRKQQDSENVDDGDGGKDDAIDGDDESVKSTRKNHGTYQGDGVDVPWKVRITMWCACSIQYAGSNLMTAVAFFSTCLLDFRVVFVVKFMHVLRESFGFNVKDPTVTMLGTMLHRLVLVE